MICPKLTIMREFIVILCMLICFVLEWQMIDRFTVVAYEIRYQEDLEAFRMDASEYFMYRRNRTGYDCRLEEHLRSVQEEIECFPVEKSFIQDISYVDSWYGERNFGGERRHEGTDLMSKFNARGEIPVVSMTDGEIKNMGWLQLGGWRIGIQSPSGHYYYYAHLDSYADNLSVGSKVYAGQWIGFMGDSGYGEEGTVGMFDVHLHVGIYMYDENENEISINPYPFLTQLQKKDEY